MPNRFVELTVRLGLFFAVCIVVDLCLQLFGSFPLAVHRIAYAVVALVLYIVNRRYMRVRNGRFIHKVYIAAFENDYDTAFTLMNLAIKRQPKALWLRIELAIFIGLSGDVQAFYQQQAQLFADKRFWKSGNRYTLLVLCDAINLLVGSTYQQLYKSNREEATSDKHLAGVFHWLFAMSQTYFEGEYDSAVNFAKEFEPPKCDFFWLFKSFIMFRSFEALRDAEQSRKYRAEYNENPLSTRICRVD